MSSLHWLWRSADLALRTRGCFQVPERDKDLLAPRSATYCSNGCYSHTGAAQTPAATSAVAKPGGRF